MNRRLIVAFIALASLVSMTRGEGLPQGAKVETTGTPTQNTVFVITSPRPSTELARDSEKTLEGDKLRAEQYNDRGIMYSEKGEYDLAISEFNKALEICPMCAETYNNRGITYSKKGQHDLAVADFTKALEIKPDMAKAYYNRGITYGAKGQYDLALRDFNRSLELNPNQPPSLVNRGSVHVYLACSDWEQACQLGNCAHLEEAVKIGLCIKVNGNRNSSP